MDVQFVHLHQVHPNVPVNVFQESYNMYQAMKLSFELVTLGNLDEAKTNIISVFNAEIFSFYSSYAKM
jgi:hypothetical protein